MKTVLMHINFLGRAVHSSVIELVSFFLEEGQSLDFASLFLGVSVSCGSHDGGPDGLSHSDVDDDQRFAVVSLKGNKYAHNL